MIWTGGFSDGERRRVVRVLTPDQYSVSRPLPAVYLLSAWGALDERALEVVEQNGLHNRHDVICVLPEMGGWYGEHADDRNHQSQTLLRQRVVPFVEDRYACVPGPEGRMLFGFSKSGWGAFSLLFHNPDFYGYAVSWDAPLCFEDRHFGEWGRDAFGTLENWRFFHPVDSAAAARDRFQDRARLVHLRGPAWADHAAPYCRHLDRLGIKYVYRDGYMPEHDWNAEWMVPAFDHMMQIARESA